MNRSLRSRLLSRAMGVLVATFLFTAIVLYLLMRSALLAEFAAALLLEGRALAAHVEQVSGKSEIELEDFDLPEYSREHEPHYFQIWTETGRSVVRSPLLGDHNLTPPDNINAQLVNAQPVPAMPTNRDKTSSGPRDFIESRAVAEVLSKPLKLPNGHPGRQVAFAFRPRLDDHDADSVAAVERPLVFIAIARPTTQLDWTLKTLGWLLFAVTAVAIAVSGAWMNAMILKELKSLETLAHSIRRVGVADLSERIQMEHAPREVVPVVERLNELLVRLDDVLLREKAFSTDVAHELRTPLAGLETALEVCAMRRREPAAYEDTVLKCLHVTRGMHRMVNSLLLLARAESHQLATLALPLRLRPFFEECWSLFQKRAAERSLAIQWEFAGAETAAVDRENLQVVVNNLFDNAVTYTNSGGWIRIAVAHHEQTLTVRISNSGCGLNEAHAARLFDRFWRGNAARSDVGTHCGLGLALCRKIVELLGGEITAEIKPEVFLVTVILPATILFAQNSSETRTHLPGLGVLVSRQA